MESSTTAATYEGDLVQWSQQQATAIRAGRWADVDAANVAEEIESLGRSDRREIKSRLTVLITHLLKFEYQPGATASWRSWRSTVSTQVREMQTVLDESPSLQREFPDFVAYAYPRARKDAANETGLPIARFPDVPSTEFIAKLSALLAGVDVPLP
jgi:hypothetical protein